jgi:hypothetical protein
MTVFDPDAAPAEIPIAERAALPLAEPPPPSATAAAPSQGGAWLLGVAFFSYMLCSALPLFEAAKVSSALGPSVLGFFFGLMLLARRPLSFPYIVLGLSLAAGCVYFAWASADSSHAAWQALSLGQHSAIWAECLRRAGWALGATLGLALFCQGPRSISWIGALACFACSAALGLGWAWPIL